MAATSLRMITSLQPALMTAVAVSICRTITCSMAITSEDDIPKRNTAICRSRWVVSQAPFHYRNPTGQNPAGWILTGVSRQPGLAERAISGTTSQRLHAFFLRHHRRWPSPAAKMSSRVRVDPRESEGQWYEGGGIYRHVYLTALAPLHVAQWGTHVVSTVPNGEARRERQSRSDNPNHG